MVDLVFYFILVNLNITLFFFFLWEVDLAFGVICYALKWVVWLSQFEELTIIENASIGCFIEMGCWVSKIGSWSWEFNFDWYGKLEISLLWSWFDSGLLDFKLVFVVGEFLFLFSMVAPKICIHRLINSVIDLILNTVRVEVRSVFGFATSSPSQIFMYSLVQLWCFLHPSKLVVVLSHAH